MKKSIRFFLMQAIAISLLNCLNAQNRLYVGINITPILKLSQDGIFDDNPNLFMDGRIFNYGAFISYDITNSVSLNTGWNLTKRNIKLKNIDIDKIKMLHILYQSILITINYNLKSLNNSLKIVPYLGAGISFNFFSIINSNKEYNHNNETLISTDLRFKTNPKIIPSVKCYFGISRIFYKIGKFDIEVGYDHLFNNESHLDYTYSIQTETIDKSGNLNFNDNYLLRLLQLRLNYSLQIKYPW